MAVRTRTTTFRPLAEGMTLVLAVALMHSVWRQTGYRIVILTEAAAVGAVAINVVWAVVATRRLDVRVLSSPTDATVGDVVACEVAVTGSRTPIALRMLSTPGAPWHSVAPPARGDVEATAPHRFVAGTAIFEAQCAAPLGLVAITRRFVVDLPAPLHVGPRPLAIPGFRFPDSRDQRGADDVVRGTRPFVPGDPLRAVHWPSTARTGTLTMREYEPPPAPLVVLTVDLGAGVPAGEDAAGRGAWVACEALRRGHRVVLATAESNGPVSAPVHSAIEVSRRLAAAVAGRAVAPDPPPGAVTISISTDGRPWLA